MNARKSILRNLILLVIVILIGIVGFIVVDVVEKKQIREKTEQVAKDYEAKDYYEFNNKYYKQNDDLQVVLCVGLDSYDSEDSQEDSYRNNRLADCIVLLVLNKVDKTVLPIQINRDTMTSFHMLGINGRITNDSFGQIALSHTYGKDGKDDLSSLQNTRDAVSELMCDIRIDNYISITMDAVAKINDKAGGVTVYVEDDFSSIDPSIVQGRNCLLLGEQALTFVRARKGLDDSSNIARLNRQRVYLRALYETCKQRVKNDNDFVRSALDSIEVKSSESVSGLSDIGNTLLEYELLDAIQLKGEAIENGYIEFYPDQEALEQLCINIFYKEVK